MTARRMSPTTTTTSRMLPPFASAPPPKKNSGKPPPPPPPKPTPPPPTPPPPKPCPPPARVRMWATGASAPTMALPRGRRCCRRGRGPGGRAAVGAELGARRELRPAVRARRGGERRPARRAELCALRVVCLAARALDRRGRKRRPTVGAELGARHVGGPARRAGHARRGATAASGEPRPTAGEPRCRRGRGTRAGGRRPSDLLAETEPRREECALGRAAAFGHALARSDRRLACGVRVEAAGQARVGGVLGQGLELGLVLLREVDVEVAHAGDEQPVRVDELVPAVDHGLFDLGGVRREPEDRPPVAHDLARDL